MKRPNTEDLDRGLLCWELVSYEGKNLRTDISLHSGIVRQHGVGSSNEDIERLLKWSLKVGLLSLLEPCERNLEGGLPS